MRNERSTPGPRKRDELRELLRRGDPAGDEGGLGAGEAARMRRAVLAAARPPRSGAGVRLAWAVAAASLILAAVLGGRGLWLPRSSSGPAPEAGASGLPERPPVGGRAALVEPRPREDPAPAVAEIPADAPERSVAEPAPAGAAARPAAAPAAGARGTPARAARQVQFKAPGGTRIIWRLDPEFKL